MVMFIVISVETSFHLRPKRSNGQTAAPLSSGSGSEKENVLVSEFLNFLDQPSCDP